MYTCLSDGTIANDDTWNAKDVVSGRVEECRARLCVWEIAIRQRRDNHPTKASPWQPPLERECENDWRRRAKANEGEEGSGDPELASK